VRGTKPEPKGEEKRRQIFLKKDKLLPLHPSSPFPSLPSPPSSFYFFPLSIIIIIIITRVVQAGQQGGVHGDDELRQAERQLGRSGGRPRRPARASPP
jgi:hypothetical protein